MRDSIGGAWLTGLVITFMLLFVAYLTVMINYSTAFKTKNEMTAIIEEHEGLSSGPNGSVKIINQYLANSGYVASGKCECPASASGCYGALNNNANNNTSDLLRKTNLENLKTGGGSLNRDYYYCIQFYSTPNDTGYYELQVFLNFDLPVLGQLGQFKVKGQTNKMKYPITWNDVGINKNTGYK